MMSRLKDFINIDKRFQNSINLQLDIQNKNKVNGYIPTRSSINILDGFLENVLENKDNANVLIGPYGKGKSHLLLVLLAILSDKTGENTKNIVAKISEVSDNTGNKAKTFIENQRPLLPVIISGTDRDLNHGFIAGLVDSLKRNNLMDIAPDSYYGKAVETIDTWKKDYPDTFEKLKELLKKDSISVSEFEMELSKMNRHSLEKFKEIYPRLTSGSMFSPMVESNSMTLYREVSNSLSKKGYGGIYIIFDEFSKYIEGHEKETFAYDMKILQDMCELASNSKVQQIHITFVAHKSIKEYGSALPSEMINAFTGVEGRLKEIRFLVSAQNNFEIIKHAINKTDEGFKDFIYNNDVNNEIIEQSYKIPCFESMFTEKDYKEIVAEGCFPMLPLTAYSLLNISEKVAQNERSIFTFIANEEKGTVLTAIEEGREDLIAVDMVYDYFENLFRDNVSLTNIHNEWLKADYAITKAESLAEEKVIKALAILHMINKQEELPVKKKEIWLASGLDERDFSETLLKLEEKEVISYRNKLGVYAFKNNVGVNLEKEINEQIQKQPLSLKWGEEFTRLSDLEYELPKKYNQEYTMTRYFKYVYMTPEQFLNVKNSKYLFETYSGDGLIVCLIVLNSADEMLINAHVRKLNDERLVVVCPKINFERQQHIRKIIAIEKLLNDKEFLEENKVIEQELKIYKEDLLFEINGEFEQIYMPENHKCSVFNSEEDALNFETNSSFNRFLSNICLRYFEHAPKINNELINRQNISAQVKKARGIIVDTILGEGDFAKYENGTSQEATIFRATLLHTGIIENSNLDDGCKRIIKEIRKFIERCGGRKVSFDVLYSKLMGKKLGARKGIIPIFIAREIINLHDTPIVYLEDTEVEITSEILNNINEKAEKYYLYVEKESIQKEKYLVTLEKEFLTEELKKTQQSKTKRLSNIVKGIQRWYRALDQYSLTFTKQLFNESQSHYLNEELFEQMCNFRRIFKGVDLNPREVLFEKIPLAFTADDSEECNYKTTMESLVIIKDYLNHNLDNVKVKTAADIKKLFGQKETDSLNATLKDWYDRQSKKAKSHVFTENVTTFMSYIEKLNTNDEKEIVARLCKIVSGIYINDWKNDSYHNFMKELESIKNKIEQIKESDSNDNGESKIVIQTGNKKIERFFDEVEDDSTSYFFKNAIDEAMEEFGDTLELNQKISVLMKAIENLIEK
jgi:energy-coupling factor transporter ATP-binding protein EcfA2